LQSDNRFDEAIAHYRRAAPSRPITRPRTATWARRSGGGRLSYAVTAYEHALALQPDEGEAHYNLANALQDQGKRAKRSSISAGLRLRPDCTALPTTRGGCDSHGCCALPLRNGPQSQGPAEMLDPLRPACLDPFEGRSRGCSAPRPRLVKRQGVFVGGDRIGEPPLRPERRAHVAVTRARNRP